LPEAIGAPLNVPKNNGQIEFEFLSTDIERHVTDILEFYRRKIRKLLKRVEDRM
jgi:hypothetical protein